jgi:hypothetical protein
MKQQPPRRSPPAVEKSMEGVTVSTKKPMVEVKADKMISKLKHHQLVGNDDWKP